MKMPGGNFDFISLFIKENIKKELLPEMVLLSTQSMINYLKLKIVKHCIVENP